MEDVLKIDLPLRASGSRIREAAATATGKYTLIYTKSTELRWVNLGLERMVQVAEYTGAAMV